MIGIVSGDTMVINQSKMINVALIGKGYWGSKLEKYIRENTNFCLMCTCDSRSDLKKEVYTNKEIDAVVLATPIPTHYSLAKAALYNSKHVMSEKPLALRRDECEELRDLAQDRKRVLFTDYTYTFSRGLHLAQRIIQEGTIGEIGGIEMCLKQLGRFGRENVYWLLGAHMLSILDMFIPLGELSFEKEEMLVPAGVVETGALYFRKPHCAGQIIVSLNYPGKEMRVVIYGSKGTIIYNPLSIHTLQVENYERITWTVASELPKNRDIHEIDESNNLQLAIEHFFGAIKGTGPSNVDRAIKVTETIESIQKR